MDLLAAEEIYHIDLRTVRGINVLQLSDQEIEEIKKRVNARGFQIASIASPIGNTPITKDFTPHVKDFMRAIHLAHYFDTPISVFFRSMSREEAADPSLILFKGKYYLFPSMTAGFLTSDNLVDWDFHP